MSGEIVIQMLWMGALVVIPVTAFVALLCRWCSCRPATRHTLWIIALLSLASPAVSRLVPTQAWFAAARSAWPEDIWSTEEPQDIPASKEDDTPRSSTELAIADVPLTESDEHPEQSTTTNAVPITTRRRPDTDAEPSRRIDRETRTQPRSRPAESEPSGRGSNASIRSGRQNRGPDATARTTSRPSFNDSTSRPRTRDLPTLTRRESAWRDAGPSDVSPRQPTITSRGSSETSLLQSQPIPRESQVPAATLSPPSSDIQFGSELAGPESGESRDVAEEHLDSSMMVESDPEATPDQEMTPSKNINGADVSDSPSSRSAFSIEWGAWLGAWLPVRDALTAVPAPPPGLWIGGVAFVFAMFFIRLMLHARWARRAVLAPSDVQSLAQDVSSMLGMRSTPRVYMIPARVSPMISCGFKPKVLLPVNLWDDLDDLSRRAVMMHELAHLRRRDHWVCWIESVLGVLYWWHPLVWWVRRRIREEADLCCDAWVTSLMPRNRRAYAQALVTTRTFLNSPVPAGQPVHGLSMASARSRRFTRRLTMVMTERVGPNLSVLGGALAGVVAVTGLIILPGLTCPPDKHEKADAPTGIVAELTAPRVSVTGASSSVASGPTVVVAQGLGGIATDCPPEPESPSALTPAESFRASAVHAFASGLGGGGPEAEGQTTFEQYINGRGGDQPDNDELRQIIRELDRRLQRLESREDKCAPNRRDLNFGPSGGGRGGPSGSPSGARGGGSGGPFGDAGPSSGGGRGGLFGGGGGVAIAGGDHSLFGDADDTSVIVRHYYLPEGKLDELTELMLRSDVPIPVAPGNGYIEVHATARQHRVFEAFARMIHPDGVRISGDELPPFGMNFQVDEPFVALEWEQAQVEFVEEAAHHRAEAVQAMEQARDLQQHIREIERERKRIERMATQASRKAERLEDRAENVREKAECDDFDDDEAESLLEEAEMILAEAASLMEEAYQLEVHAEAMEAEAEEVEYRIEELESEAEDHEEVAEEILEEMAEALEEIHDRN